MIHRPRIRISVYLTFVILIAALGGILSQPGDSLTVASAQEQLWQEVSPGSLDALKTGQQTRIAPRQYRALQLDEAALEKLLAGAPLEFSEAAKDPRTEISLPRPDGAFARFRFVESPIMEPKLAAQFPGIKTYRAWGIDDPTATARFDRTGAGFHAIILSPEGASLISPLFRENTGVYASYFMRDAPEDGIAHCEVEPENRPTTQPDVDRMAQSIRGEDRAAIASNSVVLRTYRLAVVATAEYTAANGGTIPSAMDAIAKTINKVNAIFERDLAVRLSLVGLGNNSSIIFTNPLTDPYTSGDTLKLLDENQEYLDKVLGENNYDIGHVFDMNPAGGGRGEMGVVCDDGEKAKGTSGTPTATPESLLLTVAHEIGHQFGAPHTFNGTQGKCGSFRYEDSAYEPGSGSTIMSYAGGCGSDDIQQGKDAYFHGMSLVRMNDYIDQHGGCAVTINVNNTPPIVTPPFPSLGFYVIPGRTPFTLTASAVDAEDTNPTFCWEQIDHGSPGPPTNDRVDNPLFRSFSPTNNPSRTFPNIKDVLSGVPKKGETLPTTNRWMTFIVTARDNNPSGSGSDHEAVRIAVRGTRGPFAVMQPAAGEVLEGRSFTVRWDVAGTDLPPISTANVRILLSADNGTTFPITLAASTPNDGEFTFTVPSITASLARIKVEAIDNIFFNISPAFRIINKPIISATERLTVTKGGPSVTAPVAEVADLQDFRDMLAVTITTNPLPTGVTINITNDKGIVSATATAQCNSIAATRPITLQVTNSYGLTASATFNLVVEPNPPTLGDYGDPTRVAATVIAGQSVSVSPSAPPADNGSLTNITFEATTPLLEDAIISGNLATGVVTIRTARVTQPKIYEILVTVRDNCGLTSSRKFFLEVVGSPPQVFLNPNSPARTTQGGTSVAPAAIATVSDQQDGPGALAVSATAPAGLSPSVTNSNGTINATAIATCAVAPGAYTATLLVTDSAGATASTPFSIIVDPNPPPTLGSYLKTGVTVGVTVTAVPSVGPADPNNSVTLTVNPSSLPGGGSITVNQANGRVTVTTLGSTQPGVYPVEVRVTDACGALVTKSFNLTVRGATCPTERRLIYVADTDNHRIQFSDTGGSWVTIGSKGDGAGQFNSPEAVVASFDERTIYVADTGNSRIQWSQDRGATWSVFATSLRPQGLALDRDGNLYVSDANDSAVIRYIGGVPGSQIMLAASGSGAGQVRNPSGLAIDCRMNLYIADTGNNRILAIATADAVVLANTGTVVAASGAGLDPAQVSAPQGVAVDDTGKLYVADTGNDRVLLIKSAPLPGEAAQLCTPGPALGQARGPEGVTIAAFLNGPLAGATSIVVSDTTNHRIQGSRLPVGTWTLLGGPGAGTGQFIYPSKIR